MGEFVASNGVPVSIDSDGYVNAGCTNPAKAVQAMREFFRNERDKELGRWRVTIDGHDYLVFDDGPRVAVLREGNPYPITFSRALSEDIDSDFRNAARAYFDAHPIPKPAWHDAKEGEVWVITYQGVEYPAIFQADAFRDHGGSWDLDRITAGRRIFPESDPIVAPDSEWS